MTYYGSMHFVRQRRVNNSIDSANHSPLSLRLIMTIICVGLGFSLSGSTLAYLGIDYASPGGNQFLKIHPATYFTVFSICVLASKGEFDAYINMLRQTNKGICIFLLLLSLFMVYIFYIGNIPLTAPIDTFLYTSFLAILLLRLRAPERNVVRNFLHGFMLINSVLGIIEFISGRRLIPVSLGGKTHEILLTEWRPSAFLGAPLTNACLTGAYVLILFLSDQKLNPLTRFILLLINLIALIAFGSRSAISFVLIILIFYLSYELLRAIQGKSVRREIIAIFFVGIPGIITGITLLLMSGFLDKFLNRLENDKGSAQARTAMLDLVSNIPLRDLIFAPSSDDLTSWMARYGLGYGLESCWIAFLLSYGIVGCLLLLPGLLAFSISILYHTQRVAMLPMLFFFLMASGSVSISSKTTMFAQFIALLLMNLRRTTVVQSHLGSDVARPHESAMEVIGVRRFEDPPTNFRS